MDRAVPTMPARIIRGNLISHTIKVANLLLSWSIELGAPDLKMATKTSFNERLYGPMLREIILITKATIPKISKNAFFLWLDFLK